MSNIKDVAQEAGVSIATVSRVMSGRNPVSAEMRERVLYAVETLGYRPNALAKSLREETTGTIGLIVSNVMNPFFTAVARAVEDAAAEHGYSVIIGNADEDPDKEERYVDTLLRKRVDGLLVSPAQRQSPLLGEVVASGLPVVFVDRSVEDVDAPVIWADGTKAITQLVEYLSHLGHIRLGIISGPEAIVSGRERRQTYIHAAEGAGVPIREEHIKFGDFRRESGALAMRELLELPEPPTAVFVANNLMVLGALQSASSLGLSIPKDVSVASFDDVSWFSLLESPLTAISQPTWEIGTVAAQTLLEMVNGLKYPKKAYAAEAELIIRASCAPPGTRTTSAVSPYLTNSWTAESL